MSKPNPKEKAQAEFGRRVLLILAGEEDWSSGTLEEIAENAYALELAETDENSMFKISP